MDKKKIIIIFITVAFVLITIVLAVALPLALRKGFKSTFIEKCEKFNRSDCQNLWKLFTQAHVGRDPCKIPVEAYDPLIAAAPFKVDPNTMMLWSKTKPVVNDFTANRNCFINLEKTLLGHLLDDKIWCGKEGSNETLTSGCPQWYNCENNPVRTFWNRESAAFAEAASGGVTAMLNADISKPFDPDSVFGSIEIKGLRAPRVTRLDVVMVTQKNNPGTNCMNPSLTELQNVLDKGIFYNCKEVTESQLKKCPIEPCGPCW